ncbi:MarR family transcriptional regulator [Enterobacter asburiae]|jgi:DNA-binding MarR family transcriptional regulator|uniref:MarR family transcriptional regulator n=1 Tax=Enterobacter asburiae TaxID=61645 RepID=UPI001C5B50E5|nr:MarR family transcriptional regulator [Enterobacter asburiae]MBW4210766.1 MarR family transcriptional regulator [Enterobacter asburiae]
MDNHISSRALLHRRDVIKNNPRFGEAILEHYAINDTIYKKQPLFYKTMLQESRFNIILSMCCFIFGNQAESVSEIKELCSRYKIASPNSVIAIITILRTTGRIKTWRCTEDRRKTRIAPTEKGLNELKRYMSGAFLPVSILYPAFNINVNLLDNDILRNNFFRRAAEYLFRGLTFRKVLPEVGLFIDKDGGRMIMLYIYLQAMKNKSAHGAVIDYSASTLAKEFFVSRIHVNRIIKSAQEAGYVKDRGDGRMSIYPAFIELVENYAGLYFAYVTHYINVVPKERRHAHSVTSTV